MNVEQAPHANLGTSWRLRTNFWRSLASHLARKYWVPDALAHAYDFANTLDLRRFVHHGVRHETDDELKNAGDLAAWLVQRGLSDNGNKVSRGRSTMHFDCARPSAPISNATPPSARSIKLSRRYHSLSKYRIGVADGDALDPPRYAGRDRRDRQPQLYDASANGTLDRMKMCASEECRRIFYADQNPVLDAGVRRPCAATS